MEKIYQSLGAVMSKAKKYVCRNCQYEFTLEVMEKDEANEKKIKLHPIICPRCKSDFIEERR